MRVEEVDPKIIARSLIPAVARLDALHVATAALAGVQDLFLIAEDLQRQTRHEQP